MMKTPIYAMHRDASGAILNTSSFDYSFKLNDWLKSLDVRAGDVIEFGEVAQREPDSVPAAPTLSEVA